MVDAIVDVTCADCIVPLREHEMPPKPLLPQVQDSEKQQYDQLNASTFTPPLPLPLPSVMIEFCDRCRWLHRASWVSTELMITFPSPLLKSVHIIPLNSEDTGGRFRVWLSNGGEPVLMWDRKIEGGFPELKDLKQRIRDQIQPEKSLGHSDKKR